MGAALFRIISNVSIVILPNTTELTQNCKQTYEMEEEGLQTFLRNESILPVMNNGISVVATRDGTLLLP